jgi:ribosomal protein S18 acetylase RimI-like enzyme
MDSLSASPPPPITGLIFRHYQGEQDLPAMLEVFQSTKTRDHDHALETLADIANKYRPSAGCEPSQDVLIAEAAGHVIAYGRVSWRQPESSADRIYSIAWHIRPEWQGRGLDAFFLRQSQERVSQIIRQQDADAPDRRGSFSGRRLIEAEATDLEPALARLLEMDGFKPARWGSLMTCSDLQNVPDLPLPEGLEVRPVRPEQFRAIWNALQDAFYGYPGYAQPTEDDYARWQHSTQFQPHLWQVAWDGDQAAGMVLNYLSHDPSDPAKPSTAWNEDICVRRPWRRRGLARALLARSMRMFRDMGYTQTSLGVELNNADGARQLYESMGFQLVSVLTIYYKPVDL